MLAFALNKGEYNITITVENTTQMEIEWFFLTVKKLILNKNAIHTHWTPYTGKGPTKRVVKHKGNDPPPNPAHVKNTHARRFPCVTAWHYLEVTG